MKECATKSATTLWEVFSVPAAPALYWGVMGDHASVCALLRMNSLMLDGRREYGKPSLRHCVVALNRLVLGRQLT